MTRTLVLAGWIALQLCLAAVVASLLYLTPGIQELENEETGNLASSASGRRELAMPAVWLALVLGPAAAGVSLLLSRALRTSGAEPARWVNWTAAAVGGIIIAGGAAGAIVYTRFAPLYPFPGFR